MESQDREFDDSSKYEPLAIISDLRAAIEKDKAAGLIWEPTPADQPVARLGSMVSENRRLRKELADMRASGRRADNDTLDVEALARELASPKPHGLLSRKLAQRYADILTGKAET